MKTLDGIFLSIKSDDSQKKICGNSHSQYKKLLHESNFVNINENVILIVSLTDTGLIYFKMLQKILHVNAVNKP